MILQLVDTKTGLIHQKYWLASPSISRGSRLYNFDQYHKGNYSGSLTARTLKEFQAVFDSETPVVFK